ncbi:hypothetical protein MMA231_03456 (plasmid) [Asticcacaulis sp. MM231]|uniref:hypothetical protein n=1 Tax=Asticcacaulis sp. MM231 TaxID=3157666 RepID=UPI0032D5A010
MEKICVIGSSYMGAVYKAYELDMQKSAQVEIDFFGNGRMSFGLIDIVGGEIKNARFRNSKNAATSVYDAFFIYGDMLTPHDMIATEKKLRRHAYSSQVVASVKSDKIKGTQSWQLYNKVKNVTSKPVYILSSNVMLETPALTNEKQYQFGVNALEEVLGPNTYHPFPRTIFSDCFQPQDMYYKASVYLDGKAADPSRHANHDMCHMNELGGKLILDSMISRLGQKKRPSL